MSLAFGKASYSSGKHSVSLDFLAPHLISLLFSLAACLQIPLLFPPLFLMSKCCWDPGSSLGLFLLCVGWLPKETIQLQVSDAIAKLMMLFLQHPSGSVDHFLQVLACFTTHRCSHTITIFSHCFIVFSTFIHLPFIYLCIENLLKTGKLSTL